MPGFLVAALSWLTREALAKFFITTAIFVVVAYLTPWVIGLLAGFISPDGLTTIFSAIPAGVWFFWDIFRFDIGVPMILSAHIARFSIRRIPFIG